MISKKSLMSFEGLHLTATIEAPHYLTDYVQYPVRVTYSVNEDVPGESHIVVKRYSDFDNLHKSIKQLYLPLQLPPKKLFGNFDMIVVTERHTMLDKFLKFILTIPLISKSVPVTNFFQKDQESIQDYSKIGFQQVSLDFRCESNWQIGKPLPEMGCRIKKSFISMINTCDQNKYILNWTEFGSEFLSQNSKICHSLLKALPLMKHEFIYPVCYVVDNECSVSVIRPFSDLGSLHDYLLKSKPLHSIEVKYGYQPSYPTLLKEISLFGRQILLALKYLHHKGWPYGHLHIRNVLLINNQHCAVTDVENSIIGLIPQDRHLYTGILKKLTFEEIDIYCFGRLIFHMAFGYSLKSVFIDNDDQLRWPSPEIREFLFSVLTENVLSSGFPTVDGLLGSSIFKSYSNKIVEKGPFKLADFSKEFLKSIQQYSLELLINDQKLVKSQRRKAEANVLAIKKKHQRKDELRRKKSSLTFCDQKDITARTNVQHSISNKSSSNSVHPKIVQNTVDICIPPAPVHVPVHVPAPPPPPPASSSTSDVKPSDSGRSQLFDLISGFNKSKLRKARTNDRSIPRL